MFKDEENAQQIDTLRPDRVECQVGWALSCFLRSSRHSHSDLRCSPPSAKSPHARRTPPLLSLPLSPSLNTKGASSSRKRCTNACGRELNFCQVCACARDIYFYNYLDPSLELDASSSTSGEYCNVRYRACCLLTSSLGPGCCVGWRLEVVGWSSSSIVEVVVFAPSARRLPAPQRHSSSLLSLSLRAR